ncbi:MAG: thiol peroxidase [Granulosicoccaceae bacterium]
MATTHLKGTPVSTLGELPSKGQAAPDFKLVQSDLSELSLGDLKGKRVILNTYPSVDTGVCALQTKTFSQKLAGDDNTVLIFASMDLPFAFGRFCGAEGIDNALTASDFRHGSMDAYGVKMTDGPLAGLFARSVLVLDENHQIVHSELVEDITSEPDYDAAMAALG